MKFLFIIFFIILFWITPRAQTQFENVEGFVSFLSSQNTYVKFKSTEGILVGDTLFSIINNEITPVLIVKNLSSTSVVCSNLLQTKFNVNDKIIAKTNVVITNNNKIIKDTLINIIDTAKTVEQIKSNKKENAQNISGRISISNYSNFSNTPAKASFVNNYSFSVNINNLNNSKFSIENYVIYRQENGEWNNVKKNIFNALKIYTLSVKYEFDKKSFISIGRKINSNISNIGAIDGLQSEKTFKNNFYVGGFIGSRPNYNDYSFDSKLLQFGAYLGRNLQTAKGDMQNSLAIVNQTNNSKTDRRFLYFQHSNSLLKNLHVFYTLDIDLYKNINNKSQNVFNLTNNYLSLRYRIFKKVTLSTTYDSRKNVIYYETYKNYLSTLIESEIRQGYSFQINYNVVKNLFVGGKVGYRFQKSDARPSKNVYGYITYNNLFKQQISTTFSTTFLQTTYLRGDMYNLRFSRGFNSGKLNASLGHTYVNYKIYKAEAPLIQHITDFSISSEIAKKLSLSVSIETDYEKPNRFFRLYLQLRKRF